MTGSPPTRLPFSHARNLTDLPLPTPAGSTALTFQPPTPRCITED